MFKNIIGTHKPDILDCISNLSSDEVFTPPSVVNQLLDLFPAEVWSNPNLKFLDPACKSGVFLRELAKRLMVGLEAEIENEDERRKHIFENMLYGISITELTGYLSRRSLYYSKFANSELSVVKFDNEQGNVHFSRGNHNYVRGKCVDCGAPEGALDRGDGLENHAYQFIHKKEVFPMKFDVIIGNPPYQLQDAGESTGASPIYHLFVNQAKQLSPKYLSMIIPARWYAGGKGLDAFRSEMLNDPQLRKLVDFENSSEAFPGVDVAGGICYFLWEKGSKGECEVTNFYGDQKITTKRKLNEFDILIRNGKAVPIIRKALKYVGKDGKTLSQVVSARKPFGMPTNYTPKNSGVPCWFIQRIGLSFADKQDVVDADNYLNKWKLLIPKAPIAGQTDFSKPVGFYYEGNTRIAKPGECCTESWLVACAFDTKAKVISFRSYLFTKIARFLLLQAVISQDVTRKNFCFVPDMNNYELEYSDEYLIKLLGITDDEWAYIDSKISLVGKESQ